MAATVDLNLVTAFVRVVEAGSFTGAARVLGLPKSSVSRRVSTLEEGLRVRLLQRSTRKLVLTEAGRAYFERTRAALAGLADAQAAVSDMSQEIAGPVKLSAAPDNTGMLAGLLAEFIARHPKVQVELVLTSRRVDLVAEGFDLALRAGRLADSTLVTRRLGTTDLGLFASPAFLRKAGKPRKVSDLARYPFVLYGISPDRTHLTLTGPAGEEKVAIDGPLIVDDMSFLADAVAAGVGVGLLPEVYFGWLWKGGRRAPRRDFVRLLPEHGVQGGDLHVVSPPTAYEPTRVALLRDFLTERIRPLMQKCGVVHAERRAAVTAAARRRTPPPGRAPAR